MAGSFGEAVPGSSPFQMIPSRTTSKPSPAIRCASAGVRTFGPVPVTSTS